MDNLSSPPGYGKPLSTQYLCREIPNMQANRIVGISVALMLLSSGCGDAKLSSNSTTATTHSKTKSTGGTEGIVKIAVLIDGTVIVNSETVPIDSLASKLDSIGTIKEFWYHREAPNVAEPHENAIKAIEEIANRKLPIAMYLDQNFTQRVRFFK